MPEVTAPTTSTSKPSSGDLYDDGAPVVIDS
jgi:hypothetical protein